MVQTGESGVGRGESAATSSKAPEVDIVAVLHGLHGGYTIGRLNVLCRVLENKEHQALEREVRIP